jgi:hypothetical protein
MSGGTELFVESRIRRVVAGILGLNAEHPLPVVFVWAHVVSPERAVGGSLLRAGPLTPYLAETIVEDALRAGRGSLIKLRVPQDVTNGDLARVGEQFSWLGDRGVRVNVQRGWQLDAPPAPATPSHATS